MAKLKGGRRKAEGFRCYINFYPHQANRGLKREGVIRFINKEGKPVHEEQFDYLDQIPSLLRERLQEFEKQEKAKKASSTAKS